MNNGNSSWFEPITSVNTKTLIDLQVLFHVKELSMDEEVGLSGLNMFIALEKSQMC